MKERKKERKEEKKKERKRVFGVLYPGQLVRSPQGERKKERKQAGNHVQAKAFKYASRKQTNMQASKQAQKPKPNTKH